MIEALLFWVLDKHFSDEVEASVDGLVRAGVFKKKPRGDLEDWGLHQYVEIATDLKILDEDTTKLVRLAKDYRNLIHPGRIKSKGQVCNRPTAMTAISALDRVVEDLTKKFSASATAT